MADAWHSHSSPYLSRSRYRRVASRVSNSTSKRVWDDCEHVVRKCHIPVAETHCPERVKVATVGVDEVNNATVYGRAALCRLEKGCLAHICLAEVVKHQSYTVQ